MIAARLLLVLLGCAAPAPLPPAPDAAPIGELDMKPGGAYFAGALFCDHFAGVCRSGVCREQCRAGFPRCEVGELEHHERDVDGADICVCLPGAEP